MNNDSLVRSLEGIQYIMLISRKPKQTNVAVITGKCQGQLTCMRYNITYACVITAQGSLIHLQPDIAAL